MILAGVALIERFDWILYVFGAFLILSGLRMAKAPHAPEPEEILSLRWRDGCFPSPTVSPESGLSFGSTANRPCAPLALALIMIETSDLIFAIDSIPAVFAIIEDPFLVFTSNIMAVLGYARCISPWRALSNDSLPEAFAFTNIGFDRHRDVVERYSPCAVDTTYYTLGAICLILSGGVIASILRARRN